MATTPNTYDVSDDATSAVSPARSRIGTTYVDHNNADMTRITKPEGLGDERGDNREIGLIERFTEMAASIFDVGVNVQDIRNVMAEALARTLWVSSAELNNTAGTTGTFDTIQYAYAVGFTAKVGYAVQLRHIQVGSDQAGVILLFATRGTTPDPHASGLRALGAVRVTATMPTGFSNLQPLLDDGENLVVALLAASGKLDFSCEYRALRSGS